MQMPSRKCKSFNLSCLSTPEGLHCLASLHLYLCNLPEDMSILTMADGVSKGASPLASKSSGSTPKAAKEEKKYVSFSLWQSWRESYLHDC